MPSEKLLPKPTLNFPIIVNPYPTSSNKVIKNVKKEVDCKEYKDLKNYGLVLSNIVTVLVSVVNIVVRNLTFGLIDFIGYETES